MGVKQEQEKYKKLSEEMFIAIARAVDVNDPYTAGHSQRVANYSMEIAERLGLSEEESLEVFYAGLLHDVGKLGIDNKIINKNGKLSSKEYSEVKRHPVMGAFILEGISIEGAFADGAKYHHERVDGKGYPTGTKDIPLIGRIIAVADAYDAMTSRRSYRDVLPQEKVKEEIKNGRGTQFDSKIADIMLEMIASDTRYLMRQRKSHKNLETKIFFDVYSPEF